MAFGRRKSSDEQASVVPDEAAVVEAVADSGEGDGIAAPRVRPDGPKDIAEVEVDQQWLDFGGLRLAPVEGLEVQVQLDEASGRVSLITAILGNAGAQMHAFAAPRTAGIWDEVRAEIKTGITGAGGLVEEAEGPFGLEIRARIPQEGTVLQPARFVGVDGPRWFFRAILLGDAALPGDGAAAIEDVVRNVVVVRGDAAMAPREQLPMHVPGQQPSAAPSANFNPYVRGPEITEVR